VSEDRPVIASQRNAEVAFDPGLRLRKPRLQAEGDVTEAVANHVFARRSRQFVLDVVHDLPVRPKRERADVFRWSKFRDERVASAQRLGQIAHEPAEEVLAHGAGGSGHKRLERRDVIVGHGLLRGKGACTIALDYS
jgi:hypothetical protein